LKKVLVTGAAGFIGMNLAVYLANSVELTLIDDFSRVGSRRNADILKSHSLEIHEVDISQEFALNSFLDSHGPFDGLVHLAAQTSLLESIKDPKKDFDTNALGTLNILEHLRKKMKNCKGIFLASNKVYGNLRSIEYQELESRFTINELKDGVDEGFLILPEGGYSISKSISDAYVQEYGKRFNMPIISLRQSAVYGPNQNSRSDQGWVSFFTEEYIANRTVALRGVGKQVRDVLHIDDFCKLMEILLGLELPHGESYNVGGGPDFSLSILELFTILESLGELPMKFETGQMSLEDQPYFVSNNKKISKLTGWSPSVSPTTGISNLYQTLLSKASS
jgi:CDP-paratose 2-epimerase